MNTAAAAGAAAVLGGMNAIPASLPTALVDRGTSRILHREGRQRPAARLSLFEDEPQRQMSMKRLSRDEAFLLAVNIAKLPSVPRQILKDIPRPPRQAATIERERLAQLWPPQIRREIAHTNCHSGRV
jgi:hypothetical protein